MYDFVTPGIELFSTMVYLLLIFLSVVISVMGSIMIIFFLTRRKIDVKEEIVFNQNVGIALVLGSFIWTLARMCLEAVKPIMNNWYGGYASGFTPVSALGFVGGIVGGLLSSLLIGVITIFLSLKVLTVVNKDIDEWEEIKQHNVAVAIVISVTVIVVGTFFQSIIGYIVSSIFSFSF
jgi:hypothetical protein